MGACKQEYNPPPNRKRVSLGGELVGSGELVIQNTLVANQKLERQNTVKLCYSVS